MTPDEVIAAMNTGADALDDSCDYLVVGEMGIGNTTAAAALSMGRFGGDASDGSALAPALTMRALPIRQKLSIRPSLGMAGSMATRCRCSLIMAGVSWRRSPERFWRHACAQSR